MGSDTRRRAAIFFALGALVLCLVPALAYAGFIARAPHVTAEQARELLLRDEARVVFLEPMTEASAPIFEHRSTTLSKLDPTRKNVLVCRAGIRSALLARQLEAKGHPGVLSLKGGLQEWVASGAGRGVLMVPKLDARAELGFPNFRRSPMWEQGLVVFSFFGVKTAYTLLAAAVFFVVWRRSSPEFRALAWALASFLVGEACCFANVILCAERSFPLEHAHGLLMAVSLGFASYVALHGLVDRLGTGEGGGSAARLGSPGRAETLDEARPCAALGLCGVCTNRKPRVCRLRRLAQMLVPMLAAVALLPMMAELQGSAYTTLVFKVLHGYWHPVVHQLFELRYLPMVAAGLLLWCEVLLWLPGAGAAMLASRVASAALGAMGFSFMRLVFVAPFADRLLWFVFWEELTELLYIAAVVGVLWVFRSNWFAKDAPAS